MSYKVRHKETNNVIGVFNELDEQAINQLIINNCSNTDQYEVIEFTPEELPMPTIEDQQQEVALSDIEILYDILRTKGILLDEEIPERIVTNIETKNTLVSQLES
jgi:DNA polymerase III alpha subunit (gram-positive type)